MTDATHTPSALTSPHGGFRRAARRATDVRPRYVAGRAVRGFDDGLFGVWDRQQRRATVLRALRRGAGPRLPGVWGGERDGDALLRRLRSAAHGGTGTASDARRGRGCSAGGSRLGGGAPGLRAVLRRGGLLDALGVHGPRGHACAAFGLLRRGAHRGEPLRRIDREVHRRRCDGGVGVTGGPRGRRRACGPRGAGPRRGGGGVRRARRVAAAGPGGGRHRSGRGDREPSGGPGRGGPCQHRGPGAGDRAAGHGLRRRGDAPGHLRRDRLRRRRIAPAEGQDRAAAPLPGRAGRGRGGRGRPRRRVGGAVRGA